MNLHEYRRQVGNELVGFLNDQFTKELGEPSNWWQSHVVRQLSYGQQGQVRSRGIERLGQLDLHALLRVFDRNYAEISNWCNFPAEVRTLGKGVSDQRNRSSHESLEDEVSDPADDYRDVDTLLRFATALKLDKGLIGDLQRTLSEALQAMAGGGKPEEKSEVVVAVVAKPIETEAPAEPIQPVITDTIAEGQQEVSSTNPGTPAAAFDRFMLFGPEESINTEITSFNGAAAPATEIPWLVEGPQNTEFKIHIYLIDDPGDDGEIGQVFCDSRLGSPQSWDQIVRRLRIGIRQRENGDLYMDLRIARANATNRATRNVVPIDQLEKVTGIALERLLRGLGATDYGPRSIVTAEIGRTRNRPAVAFAQDDLITPIAAFVAVTIAPLLLKPL